MVRLGNRCKVSRHAIGLQIVLSPKIAEYLPTSSELGFVVMVHGHGFREDVSSDAEFVESGYVTYIGLRLVRHTWKALYLFRCFLS